MMAAMLEIAYILLLQGACNVLAVLHGLGYARLAMFPSLAADERALLTHWFWWTTVASFSAITPLLVAAAWPVVRSLRGGLHGDSLVAARRRALNLPVILTRLSIASWFVGAGSLPLYAAAVMPGFDWVNVMHGIIGTLLIGSVASTFVYYLVEWRVRAGVVPRLFPDGDLAGVPGVTGTPIGFKILLLLVLVCVLPVAVLTFAAWSGTASPAAVLYLGVSFIGFGAVQGWFIARSVARPVRKLAAAMQRVERNDLSVQAAVTSVDEVGRLAAGFNRMVAGLREAEFVRDTFGRYVSAQVRDEILSGGVVLGGELRTVTVLFADVRGFTALSERLEPQSVVAMLNDYLERMVNVVVAHGGTVDKFIGDAVMATFGVPLARPGDAARALRAAVEMQRELTAWNRERGLTEPLRIGIGLHTGAVVAGNIGSAKKMEYTVIGDTVNTASRIEQLTKKMGAEILASDVTVAAAGEGFAARDLGAVEVAGKRLPLRVFAVDAGVPGDRAYGNLTPE